MTKNRGGRPKTLQGDVRGLGIELDAEAQHALQELRAAWGNGFPGVSDGAIVRRALVECRKALPRETGDGKAVETGRPGP